jgi:hypothetical protein
MAEISQLQSRVNSGIFLMKGNPMKLTAKHQTEIGSMTAKELVAFWNVLQFSKKMILMSPEPYQAVKEAAVVAALKKFGVVPVSGSLITLTKAKKED